MQFVMSPSFNFKLFDGSLQCKFILTFCLNFSNLIVQQHRYCIYVDRNMFRIIFLSDYSFYWVEKKNFIFFKEMREDIQKGKWTGFQLPSRKSWFSRKVQKVSLKKRRHKHRKSKIEHWNDYIHTTFAKHF